MVNYSRIIGEVMVLMKKPSVSESPSGRAPERAPDWILRRQKLAAVEKWFWWSSDFFGIFREYIGATPRAEGAQGSHKPVGRGLPPWPWGGGLWGPWGSPALALKLPDLLPVQKKSFRGFSSVWTPFQNLLWKGSKTWKTWTDTWH